MNDRMRRLSLIAFALAFVLALLPYLARGAALDTSVSPGQMAGSMLSLIHI